VFYSHEVNNHFKSALGITLILLTLPFLSLVSSWYEEVPELEEIKEKMFPAAYQNVVEIDAGGYHTCAIIDDGSVSCWGLNNYGTLTLGLIANLLLTGEDLSSGILREIGVRLVTLEGAFLLSSVISILKANK